MTTDGRGVADVGDCIGNGHGEDVVTGEDNGGVIADLRLPEGSGPTLQSKVTPCPRQFPTAADSGYFLEIAKRETDFYVCVDDLDAPVDDSLMTSRRGARTTVAWCLVPGSWL